VVPVTETPIHAHGAPPARPNSRTPFIDGLTVGSCVRIDRSAFGATRGTWEIVTVAAILDAAAVVVRSTSSGDFRSVVTEETLQDYARSDMRS
jgi:hypothetical protein